MLDDHQVVRAAPGDQVTGLGALGVQGIGDDCPGQVDAVQEGGEHRDLTGLGLDVDLARDHFVRVVESAF